MNLPPGFKLARDLIVGVDTVFNEPILAIEPSSSLKGWLLVTTRRKDGRLRAINHCADSPVPMNIDRMSE